MSHSLDVLESRENTMFFVKESFENSLDADCMVLDRHFLLELFLSCSLMLEASHFHSDPLHKTFGEKIVNLIVLHIKELILK